VRLNIPLTPGPLPRGGEGGEVWRVAQRGWTSPSPQALSPGGEREGRSDSLRESGIFSGAELLLCLV